MVLPASDKSVLSLSRAMNIHDHLQDSEGGTLLYLELNWYEIAYS